MSVSFDSLNAYVATQKPHKPLTAITSADRAKAFRALADDLGSAKAQEVYKWLSQTDEERLADIEAKYGPADNATENVWGTIISGGRVVAEIYKSGAYGTLNGATLNIDPNASLEEKAKLLANRLGGRLQHGAGPYRLGNEPGFYL